MNLSVLINMKGFTVGRFASASGIQETRLKEIIAGDPASVEEAWNMSQALGMTPGDLYQYLRRPVKPGKIISIEGRIRK